MYRLTDTFECRAQPIDGGIEYWLGGDLQHLLGYTERAQTLTAVVIKTKTAGELSGYESFPPPGERRPTLSAHQGVPWVVPARMRI